MAVKLLLSGIRTSARTRTWVRVGTRARAGLGLGSGQQGLD